MKRNLKRVAAFADPESLNENQLRWLIFNSRNNGLDDHGAIVRIGRRVYIDVDAFDRWIDSQQVAA